MMMPLYPASMSMTAVCDPMWPAPSVMSVQRVMGSISQGELSQMNNLDQIPCVRTHKMSEIYRWGLRQQSLMERVATWDFTEIADTYSLWADLQPMAVESSALAYPS